MRQALLAVYRKVGKSVPVTPWRLSEQERQKHEPPRSITTKISGRN
jgi:hypothetical protein